MAVSQNNTGSMSLADTDGTVSATFGRRSLLRVGGLTVTTAALIAACSGNEAGEAGRVGNVPEVDKLPTATITDVTLLRTASSLEYSAIAVYDAVAKLNLLTGGLEAAATRFRDEHGGHANIFEKLTKEAGGKPWTCGNPRIDSVIIAPMLSRIVVGVPASQGVAAIPPSDDVLRDILNVAHALESLAGATYQSLVPLLSEPALRRQAMLIAADEVRHASLLALTINTSRPGGYVSSIDAANAQPSAPATTASPTTVQDIAAVTTVAGAVEAPPATFIPSVVAIPGQFGSLAALTLVVGAPDVNGTRFKAQLETPSLNTLVYEYEGECS